MKNLQENSNFLKLKWMYDDNDNEPFVHFCSIFQNITTHLLNNGLSSIRQRLKTKHLVYTDLVNCCFKNVHYFLFSLYYELIF